MPWICPMCSTNNEDTDTVCFVCDTPKPAVPPPAPSVCTLTRLRTEEVGRSGDITVPEKYNVIGAGAFEGCTALTSITLHAGVRKIEKNAFSGCHALRTVHGGEGLTSIGSRAFYDCPSLSVSYRPHAASIAADAFAAAPPPPPPPPPPRVAPTVPRYPSSSATASTASTSTKREFPWVAILSCSFVFFIVLSLVMTVVDFAGGNHNGFLWLSAALMTGFFLGTCVSYSSNEFPAMFLYVAVSLITLLNTLLHAAIGDGYQTVAWIVALLVAVTAVIGLIWVIWDMNENFDAEGCDLAVAIVGTVFAVFAFIVCFLV